MAGPSPVQRLSVLHNDALVLVVAETEDGVVHLARLKTHDGGLAYLHFTCRKLIIDESAGMASYLRDNEVDVTCMACVAGSCT